MLDWLICRDNFNSSFLIWMHFICFTYLIALARTSSTMLNGCYKSEHLCLFSDLRGKTKSFSPLSTLAVVLLYMAFIMLRYSPPILNLLRVFIMKVC